jgi:hypothetical protein
MEEQINQGVHRHFEVLRHVSQDALQCAEFHWIMFRDSDAVAAIALRLDSDVRAILTQPGIAEMPL